MAFLAVSAILGPACTGGPRLEGDPKKRLNDYISYSFAVKSPQDRQQLASYLTGDAKRRLLAWSDDQFREAFVDTKRQFLKLAFRDVRAVSPSEVNITYELTYLDQRKDHEAKVTNRKLCQLVQEQGNWFINDVHNIKELVEYKNEMSFSFP
jgi:hypothetical protein